MMVRHEYLLLADKVYRELDDILMSVDELAENSNPEQAFSEHMKVLRYMICEGLSHINTETLRVLRGENE